MAPRINYSGLIIAGNGFFLTRFTVTLSLNEEPLYFILAGIIPLTLGLGLAAFGVALAVVDVEAATVRTTAIWCVIGTGTMIVLALFTIFGSAAGEMPAFGTVRSRAFLSNFLIGGAIGGTFTGLYASRNRRQRDELRHQADRLEVLNRMLRHEVLNALTVIHGRATATTRDARDAFESIRDQAQSIEEVIEEVRFLARDARPSELSNPTIELNSCLATSVATVERAHPTATISFEPHPDDPLIKANERIELAFTNVIENAIVHAANDAPSAEIQVDTTPRSARIRIIDEGPGLPEQQRRLLELGEIAEFDDTSSGFGLNVVRLLVESSRGTIETDTNEGSTTIVIELPRTVEDGHDPLRLTSDLTRVRPALPHLTVTFAAALIAGVVYGIASELLGGSIAGIGVFYGAASPVVGWITHEFHSVVFGFVFAGLVSIAPARFHNAIGGHVAIGIGWALVLWSGAAGIIAPVWLRLLGIPATLPSLSFPLLVSHLVWGITLGVVTAVGYTYASPPIASFYERARRRLPRR